MNRKLPALLLLALLCGCSGVGEVRTLGRYDFSYRIEGEARAAPLQIFDDGHQTYFQFREPVPAIFALDPKQQPVILPSRREGQYVVVNRIERDFVFLLDQGQTRAAGKYIGSQNRTVLPQEPAPLRDPEPASTAAPISTPAALTEPVTHQVPFATGSARIGEASREALEQLLPQAEVAERIVILAKPARRGGDREVGLMRAAAVRTWLVGHGVTRTRIRVIRRDGTIAPEHCEIRLSPAETADKSAPVVTRATSQAQPVVYGAARPIRVSAPAQPVFVDRGSSTVEGGMTAK